MADFSTPYPALFTPDAFREFLEDFAKKMFSNPDVLIAFGVQSKEYRGTIVAWDFTITLHDGEVTNDYQKFMREGTAYMSQTGANVGEASRTERGAGARADIVLGSPYPRKGGRS